MAGKQRAVCCPPGADRCWQLHSPLLALLPPSPPPTPALRTLQGAKRMQMFVGTLKGEEFNGTPTSVTQLPAPTDAGVQLAAAGGELIAVLRFEGYITPETAAAVRKQLVAAIKKGVGCVPAYVCVRAHACVCGMGARTACLLAVPPLCCVAMLERGWACSRDPCFLATRARWRMHGGHTT